MSRHYRFIRGSSPRRSTTADSALTAISDVLQCDKVSWFCHIEALTLRFVVQALIVSDDTGSSAVATNDEINVKRLQSSHCEVGTSERMSMDRTRTRLAAAALVLSALALGGCSIPIADLPSIGTTADAPGKQADPYLPVEDLPPGRDQPTIAPADRDKMKAELLAARDRQASAPAAKDAAAKDTTKRCPAADTGAAGRPC
jgi:hypothetical protein